MNDFWLAELATASTANGMRPSRPPVVLIAEASMAVQFLERAEDWAADVDRESVADMVRIHRRLLEKIETFAQASQTKPIHLVS